jgi:hypothetical protein
MYWKEWLKRAVSDTSAFFGIRTIIGRILPPLLVPALLYLQFGMGGLTSLWAIGKLAVCLLESYALAFTGVYLWKFFAAVPALLRERDRTINTLANENSNLKKESDKPVKFVFTQVLFEQKLNAPPIIIVHATVHNLRNSGLTIHHIRLTTESDKTINLRPTFNDFPKHDIDDIRFDSGMVESKYLQFDGGGFEREWTLEYLDNLGNSHRELIPRKLYSVSASETS